MQFPDIGSWVATAIETDWAVVAAIAAAISAIASMVATIALFRQIATDQKASTAELMNTFSARYNDEGMATALRELASWYLSTGESRFEEWLEAKLKGDEEALRLNQHRRLVSRFYFDAARLLDLRLINRRYAKEIISNNGLNVFYRVCEPMNIITHPHRVVRYSEVLRKLLKRYADGRIFKPGQAQEAMHDLGKS